MQFFQCVRFNCVKFKSAITYYNDMIEKRLWITTNERNQVTCAVCVCVLLVSFRVLRYTFFSSIFIVYQFFFLLSFNLLNFFCRIVSGKNYLYANWTTLLWPNVILCTVYFMILERKKQNKKIDSTNNPIEFIYIDLFRFSSLLLVWNRKFYP